MPASTTGQDRPDFVDPIALAATELWLETGSVTSPLVTSIIDVRRFQYTSIWAQTASIATFVNVLVQWYQDPTATLLVGSHRYVTFNNAPIRDTIINEGPFMKVTFTFAGGGSQGIFLYLRGKTDPSISGQGEVLLQDYPQQIAVIPFGAIGAGGQVLANASFVQRGWATFRVEAGAAGVSGIIRGYTLGGGITEGICTLWTGAANFLAQTATVALPSNLIRLELNNTTAGALNAGAVVSLGPTP